MPANNPLNALLAMGAPEQPAQPSAGFTNLFADAASAPPVSTGSASQAIAKPDSHRIAEALIRSMVVAGAARQPQVVAKPANANRNDALVAPQTAVVLIKAPVVTEVTELLNIPGCHDNASQQDSSGNDKAVEEETTSPVADGASQSHTGANAASADHNDALVALPTALALIKTAGIAETKESSGRPGSHASVSQENASVSVQPGGTLPSEPQQNIAAPAVLSKPNTRIADGSAREESSPQSPASAKPARALLQASSIPFRKIQPAPIASPASEHISKRTTIVARNTTASETSPIVVIDETPQTASTPCENSLSSVAVDTLARPLGLPVAAKALLNSQTARRGAPESGGTRLSVLRTSGEQISENVKPAIKCDTPQNPSPHAAPGNTSTAQPSFASVPQPTILHSSSPRFFEPPINIPESAPKQEFPSNNTPAPPVDITPQPPTNETPANKYGSSRRGGPDDPSRCQEPVVAVDPPGEAVTAARQTGQDFSTQSLRNIDAHVTPFTTNTFTINTPAQPLPQPAEDAANNQASTSPAAAASEAIMPFATSTAAPVAFAARLVAGDPEVSPVPPSTPKMAAEEANMPDRPSSFAAAFSNPDESAPDESAPMKRSEAPVEKPHELRIREDEPSAVEAQGPEIARVTSTAIDAPLILAKPVEAAKPLEVSEPRDLAQTLRTAEVQNAAAPVPISSAPAQEIAVRIAPPNSMPVDLHVAQRGGEIHVSVRTPDAELQTSLRQELGTLTSSLERAGYRAEMFAPHDTGAPAAREMAIRASANSRGSESQTSSGGRGGSGNSNQRQQQQPRGQNPKNWLEELENSK